MNCAKVNLTDGDKERLQVKFKEFQKERNDLLMLLVHYIADYSQLKGNASKRQRYLRRKYASQTPHLNYPICGEDGFYWSVRNISALLGRDRSSITRTLAKMRNSEEWGGKVDRLCKTIRGDSGLSIPVYHQDIFDLLLDHYEEEYLLRFANPRHGDPAAAPDMQELRRFWNQLKAMEGIQKSAFIPRELDDILSTKRRGILHRLGHRFSALWAWLSRTIRIFIPL